MLVDAAERGLIVPLEDLGIDIDAYKAAYSPYLVSLGTVDGVVYGGANAVNLKSIVWYQPAEFEKRGYEIPETWDEMIALADQIVAEGMNPFCFGMYSNGASGWLATDWMEDIMLRTGEGTATYDKWVSHDIPFNDPVVKNAATFLSQIMHTEGYVVGGTDAIVSTYFGNAQDPMFEKDETTNPIIREVNNLGHVLMGFGVGAIMSIGFYVYLRQTRAESLEQYVLYATYGILGLSILLMVVWAIREGRQAARSIDLELTGETDLPR